GRFVRRTCPGCARSDSRRRSRADLGDGGLLPRARLAGSCGGLAPQDSKSGLHEHRKNFGWRCSVNTNQTRGRVAAFFDLDGTLLPLPSLERRFVGTLRDRNAIPTKNYFRWLAQAIHLAPFGISAITHANKTYLSAVPASATGN